jgi:hypothetical protein
MDLVTAPALSLGKRSMPVFALSETLCLCMAFKTLPGNFLAEIQPTHQTMRPMTLFTVPLLYRLVDYPRGKFIGKLGMAIKTLLLTALRRLLAARATGQHDRQKRAKEKKTFIPTGHKFRLNRQAAQLSFIPTGHPKSICFAAHKFRLNRQAAQLSFNFFHRNTLF